MHCYNLNFISLIIIIFYSLTGKLIKPMQIRTIYDKEGDNDKLNNYFKCPIQYATNEFALLFDSSILDFPILTANNQLLSIIEKLITSNN